MSQSVASVHTTRPVPSGSLARDLWAAVMTGQIAGLIMAFVVMLVFTILGAGPLYPVQVIGSTLFGPKALVGFHAPAFLAGLVLHQLGPALFWGVAFGLAVHFTGARRGAGMVALALVSGVASQVIDVNLVVPAIMDALHGRDLWAENVPAFWSWAAHVVFGASLMLFPRLRGIEGPRAA